MVAGNNPNRHLKYDGLGMDEIDPLFELYVEALQTCGVELPGF